MSARLISQEEGRHLFADTRELVKAGREGPPRFTPEIRHLPATKRGAVPIREFRPTIPVRKFQPPSWMDRSQPPEKD